MTLFFGVRGMRIRGFFSDYHYTFDQNCREETVNINDLRVQILILNNTPAFSFTLYVAINFI